MGKRKPGLNAIQYDLLITAILKHTSLVSEHSDKRTIAACQRNGWLTVEPVVTDADGAWFFLLKAGLDAVLTYHTLHIYDPVDDNIRMHYAQPAQPVRAWPGRVEGLGGPGRAWLG